MLTIYPACFYEEKEGGYSVIFPDLNHLATCGNTMQEAFEMAADCLACYVCGEKELGNPLPEPSAISGINPDDEYDEYKSVFINMVSVDTEEYAKKYFKKSVKKTLTIPAWLNEKALEAHINFSQVLQEALKAKLNM